MIWGAASQRIRAPFPRSPARGSVARAPSLPLWCCLSALWCCLSPLWFQALFRSLTARWRWSRPAARQGGIGCPSRCGGHPTLPRSPLADLLGCPGPITVARGRGKSWELRLPARSRSFQFAELWLHAIVTSLLPPLFLLVRARSTGCARRGPVPEPVPAQRRPVGPSFTSGRMWVGSWVVLPSGAQCTAVGNDDPGRGADHQQLDRGPVVAHLVSCPRNTYASSARHPRRWKGAATQA